jgi:hypothetical protein
VAGDFLAGLGKTIGVLQQSPFIGVTREQLGTSLRVTFHHPYAIYYQVSASNSSLSGCCMVPVVPLPSPSKAAFCNDESDVHGALLNHPRL